MNAQHTCQMMRHEKCNINAVLIPGAETFPTTYNIKWVCSDKFQPLIYKKWISYRCNKYWYRVMNQIAGWYYVWHVRLYPLILSYCIIKTYITSTRVPSLCSDNINLIGKKAGDLPRELSSAGSSGRTCLTSSIWKTTNSAIEQRKMTEFNNSGAAQRYVSSKFSVLTCNQPCNHMYVCASKPLFFSKNWLHVERTLKLRSAQAHMGHLFEIYFVYI